MKVESEIKIDSNKIIIKANKIHSKLLSFVQNEINEKYKYKQQFSINEIPDKTMTNKIQNNKDTIDFHSYINRRKSSNTSCNSDEDSSSNMSCNEENIIEL